MKNKSNGLTNHYVGAEAKALDIRWDHEYMFMLGEHKYSIANSTDTFQTYKIEKWICLQKALENSQNHVRTVETCHISQDEIQLDPKGWFSEDTKADLYTHTKIDNDPDVFYENYVSLRVTNETSGISFATQDTKPINPNFFAKNN